MSAKTSAEMSKNLTGYVKKFINEMIPSYYMVVKTCKAIQYTEGNCLAIHMWLDIPHNNEGNCDEGIAVDVGGVLEYAKIGDFIVKIRDEYVIVPEDEFIKRYELAPDDNDESYRGRWT